MNQVTPDISLANLPLKGAKIDPQGFRGGEQQGIALANAPDARMRKNVGKRSNDAEILFGVEAMEGQPLAENAFLLKALLDQFVELGGEKDPRVVDSRMGRIGYDDRVSLLGGLEEMPGVIDVDGEILLS